MVVPSPWTTGSLCKLSAIQISSSCSSISALAIAPWLCALLDATKRASPVARAVDTRLSTGFVHCNEGHRFRSSDVRASSPCFSNSCSDIVRLKRNSLWPGAHHAGTLSTSMQIEVGMPSALLASRRNCRTLCAPLSGGMSDVPTNLESPNWLCPVIVGSASRGTVESQATDIKHQRTRSQHYSRTIQVHTTFWNVVNIWLRRWLRKLSG